MKKLFFGFVITLFTLIFAQPVFAVDIQVNSGTDSPSEDRLSDKFSVSGEVRVRGEFIDNLTQEGNAMLIHNRTYGANAADFSVLLRSRIGFNFKPTERVRFYIQIQDSREFAEETVPSATTTQPLGEEEGVDLHQGYIELDWYSPSQSARWSMRVGRTHMNHGRGRLVGVDNWRNVARSGDALVLSMSTEDLWIRLAGVMVNRTAIGAGTAGANGTYMGALHTTWKTFPNGVMTFYYMPLYNASSAAGQAKAGTGDTMNIHTLGTRVHSGFGNFDFEVEAALQLGKWGDADVLAYAIHADAGYTFNETNYPKFWLEYNYATGEDPNSTKRTKFFNLIPSNHLKYGYMDLASWSNLHDVAVMFKIEPRDWELTLGYHLFMVDQPTSTTDTFAGVTGGAGIGRLAGHEIDLRAQYDMGEYVDFIAGYSLFLPGSYMKDQSIDTTAHFAYLQIRSHF